MNQREQDDFNLILSFSDRVCFNCGPDRDCGIDYSNCERIQQALAENVIIRAEDFIN